jgi:hypothetical protein
MIYWVTKTDYFSKASTTTFFCKKIKLKLIKESDYKNLCNDKIIIIIISRSSNSYGIVWI